MTRVFDALRRSEFDGSGIDFSVSSAATGLLQIARRETIAEPEIPFPFPLPLQFPAVAPPATVVEPPGAAAPSPNNNRSDPFGQFQSLSVLVPSQSRVVCLTDKESLGAEKFRYLGVRLRQLQQTRILKKVLITSTMPQEGKSIVTANLACTLARKTRQRTLLLEGDLRRPSLSQMFGLGRLPGLCEWLQGEGGPATSIHYLEGPGFWILPAGCSPKNPLEMLQSGGLPALMEQLAAWFDWIIIDSPPVLPLGDTTIWMRLVEGILLVTRQGTTEKQQLKRGLEVLDSAKLIGTVMNSCETAHSDYHYCPPAAARPDLGPTK